MRPTEYTPEIVTQCYKYLDSYEAIGDAIPSIAGLSVYIGKARSTIYDWAKQEDKAEFSDILEKILSTQESVLLSKGLKGEFNSTITKLALGKHGYKETQDITSNDETVGFVISNA